MNEKIWFITGYSSGFGRAIAEAALDSGQRVVATARDLRSIADLDHTGICRTLALDVTDAAAIPQAVREAAQTWGTLDVLAVIKLRDKAAALTREAKIWEVVASRADFPT
jgi:NADP-dependent 3-hydroxy acid dehydrogenase YdfG